MKKTDRSVPSMILLNAHSSEEAGKCEWIQHYMKSIPDFPKQGITFQWYAPLLREPAAFARTIKIFAERYKDYALDTIVGLDSRGFIFGSTLAYELEIPFVMVRKPGKLPGKVEQAHYELEYGKSAFEIEVDSIEPDSKVLIMDDILATGGSVQAACTLVERLQAQVQEIACLIELPHLNGRKQLTYPVFSLLAVEE